MSGADHAIDSAHESGRVRAWTRRLKDSKRTLPLLFLASFSETIIVPIPIEVVLVPVMLANLQRLWTIAAVVTAGCLAAAVVGYGIGLFFFATIGQAVIDRFGYQQSMDRFTSMFADYGFFAIMAIGVMPIPFQVAMLAAGAASYPLVLFVLAATIARGIRYFGLALLVKLAGPRAIDLWHRYKAPTAAAATALVVAIGVLLYVV